MKRFTDVLSPKNWFFMGFVIIPGLVVIFRPSLWEYFVFTAVDVGCFLPFTVVAERLFRKLYPDTALYFPKLNEARIATLKANEAEALFQSLIRFPGRRAINVALGSFAKVTVPGMVTVFYWKHDCTNFEQLMKYLFLYAIAMSYLYGASYVEIHNFVSRKIAEFHLKYDWSAVFQGSTVSKPKRDFFAQENLSLLAVALLSMILLWGVTAMGVNASSRILPYEVLGVAFSGFALTFHLYFLNRKYFLGSLSELFVAFESLGYGKNDKVVPLHSSPLLAYFEKSFNSLASKLHASERELGQWVLHQTDESRFKALGEISGLVAHDLATPLQVIQYCADEIDENPGLAQEVRYRKQLSANVSRAIELINSLRAYLKNPTGPSTGTVFLEAHEYVVQLIRTRYRGKTLVNHVQFSLDPRLEGLTLSISRIELVHILDNLYKNSIENMLSNDIPSPEISVSLKTRDASWVELGIRDNGTGLSVKRFEELTATQYIPLRSHDFNDGLGLRLIRRLAERNRGGLGVVDGAEDREGTSFVLRLESAVSATWS